MKVEISSGNYDVIDSGTIVANLAEPIEFKVSNLKFIITFKSDIKQEKTTVEKEVLGTDTLKFTLINFNNSLGHRNNSSLSLGKYGSQKLFLNYGVYSISDTIGKIFHYTFFLEKEA